MHAAVVDRFDHPPRYREIAIPEPANDDEELVEVIASGLHPRVRSQASGSHYTSDDELPLIPGIDGVGRRADGSLLYFVLPDTRFGAMAERTVVDLRRSVPLPAESDPLVLAAAMNPAMSSWLALTTRIAFEPGQSVLILGATGSAGRLAIQVARHLGASRVVAAGRGAERLAALGADASIDLSSDTVDYRAGADVDVVLDYLWGKPAESAIMPLLTTRADRSVALHWIQIGAVAGPEISLPSAALRQANIRFLGSGQGSVSARGILSALPPLAEEISRGTFEIDVDARPLADVEAVWNEPTARRVVLVPARS